MQITLAPDDKYNPGETVEPEVYLPILEAHKLFGFDGHILTGLFIGQYQIIALQERNEQFLARVTDGKIHVYPPDTMVYGILTDFASEKALLQKQEALKQECLDRYKVTE